VLGEVLQMPRPVYVTAHIAAWGETMLPCVAPSSHVILKTRE
jgi:hypothetical protein